MKTIKIGVVSILFMMNLNIQAQHQPPKLSMEERIEKSSERLSQELDLSDNQVEEVKNVHKLFFEDMDKFMKESKKQNIELVKKYEQEKDSLLKEIFTKEQFEQFEKIKKDLRPRPPKH